MSDSSTYSDDDFDLRDDDSDRQRKLEQLVRKRNIGYREAKNIYYQKLRAKQAKQQRMEFYSDNPEFEFNEIIMQWGDDDWQPLEMIDDFSETEIKRNSYAARYLPFVMAEVDAALSQAWDSSTDTFSFKVVKGATSKSNKFEAETMGAMPIIEGAGLVALRIEVDDEPIDGTGLTP